LVEIELLLSVLEEARLVVVDIKLDVLCYSSKELPLKHAVSCLIIPSLTDQLNILQNFMLPNLLAQHPQVRQWVHLSSYIHFPWFYYSTMISKSWEDHFPRNNRCFIIYVIPLSYHCTISIDFWCSSCKYTIPYIYIVSPCVK
jgi:hypothetical protein